MFTLAHDQHGTWRVAHDSFRRASGEYPGQAAATMAADDNQVTIALVRGGDNFLMSRRVCADGGLYSCM